MARQERGRAIFSALGHQATSYAAPLHRQFIGNAVRWAAGTRCRPLLRIAGRVRDGLRR